MTTLRQLPKLRMSSVLKIQKKFPEHYFFVIQYKFSHPTRQKRNKFASTPILCCTDVILYATFTSRCQGDKTIVTNLFRFSTHVHLRACTKSCDGTYLFLLQVLLLCCFLLLQVLSTIVTNLITKLWLRDVKSKRNI